MALLDGIKCPVCGNEFAEGDDVVFCPDCGTPHHRECYKMAGHCVNAGLHKTDFNFYDSNIKPAESTEAPVQEAPPAAGLFTPKAEEKQTEGEAPFSPFQVAQPNYSTEYDGDTIDGDSAKDYAAAIRTNARRYIPIFKEFQDSGKKVGWNWGAFFFGPYYLLFRKMYAQGIGILCLQTAVSYLGNFFISQKAPKFYETLQNIMTSATKGLTELDIETIQSASDASVATRISGIVFVALIIIRIITALFADKFYFSTIKNLVKSVNEKINEGATFSTNMPTMMPMQQQNLDSEQLKLLYLARRGGTSLMPPLIAYLALSIIQML